MTHHEYLIDQHDPRRYDIKSSLLFTLFILHKVFQKVLSTILIARGSQDVIGEEIIVSVITLPSFLLALLGQSKVLFLLQSFIGPPVNHCRLRN